MQLVALRILGQFLEFLAWVIFARRLGPSEFGELAGAYLAARYLGLIADYGASLRGVRDVAQQRPEAEVRSMLYMRTLLSIGLTVGLFAVLLVVFQSGTALVAVAVASRGMSRDWIALGRHQPTRAALPSVIQGGLMLVGGLAFVPASLEAPLSSNRSGWTIFLACGLGLIYSVAANRVSDGPRDPVRPDAWILTATVCDQISISADTLLLLWLATPADAGIYAAIYRVPNAISLIVGLTVLSFVPRLTSELAAHPYRAARIRGMALHRSIGGSIAVIAFLPIGVLLVIPLFGSAYSEGKWAMALLLLAEAIKAFVAPLVAIFLGLKRDKQYALVFVGMAAFNVGANLVVIPNYGLTGAAAVTLVTQFGGAIAFLAATTKKHLPQGPATDSQIQQY